MKTAGKLLVRLGVLAVVGAPILAGAESVTYENTIKKIQSLRCMACHGPESPTRAEFDKDKEGWAAKSKGPRMDTYENLIMFVNGSDAGAIMRRLDDGKNTKDGKPGNMYVNLGSTDEERAANLLKFKAWVGSWNLKRRKELTSEERQAITAPKD